MLDGFDVHLDFDFGSVAFLAEDVDFFDIGVTGEAAGVEDGGVGVERNVGSEGLAAGAFDEAGDVDGVAGVEGDERGTPACGSGRGYGDCSGDGGNGGGCRRGGRLGGGGDAGKEEDQKGLDEALEEYGVHREYGKIEVTDMECEHHDYQTGNLQTQPAKHTLRQNGISARTRYRIRNILVARLVRRIHPRFSR